MYETCRSLSMSQLFRACRIKGHWLSTGMRQRVLSVLAVLFLLQVGSWANTSTQSVVEAIDDSLSGTDGDGFAELLRQFLKRRDNQHTVQPIVVPENPFLAKQSQAVHLEWFRRVWVEPFKSRNQTNVWAATATAFVDKALPAWIGITPAPPPEELAAAGKQLFEQGCRDPLVCFLAGVFEYRTRDDWRAADAFFEAALAETKSPTIPRSLGFWIAVEDARVRVRGLHQVQGLGQRAATFAQAALGKEYRAGEEEIFLRHQVNGLLTGTSCVSPTNYFTRLQGVYTKAKLPEWIRRTLVGMTEVELAWGERGSGWASEVKPEGWAGFKAHLLVARDELTAAWKLRPDRPEAAAKMITVAMAGAAAPGETPRLWFDRAVAAQFDYEPAYTALMWSYRPRWGGSHEWMLQFGKACVATRRFDTGVPLHLYDACWAMETEGVRWQTLYRRPDIAKAFLDLSEHLLSEPTRQHERALRLSAHAMNAWMVGEYRLAAQTLRDVGPKLDPKVSGWLRLRNSSETEFRAEVALFSGQGRSPYEEGERLLAQKQLPAARAAYQRAATASPADAQPMLNDRLALIAIEERLATGEWVPLKTEPGLHLWRAMKGNWSAETNGTLILHGTDSAAQLFYDARVGDSFEMRGTFAMIAPQNCCRNFGIGFGWNGAHREDWINCLISQGGRGATQAWVYDNWHHLKESKNCSALAATNKFLVRCEDRRVTFVMNGKKVFDQLQPERLTLDLTDGQVGLVLSRACTLNTWRFHDLELRRIKAAAP